MTTLTVQGSGYPPYLENSPGHRAMMAAADGPFSELQAFFPENRAVVDAVHRRGPGILSPCYTPLHCAIQSAIKTSDWTHVAYLINQGVRINIYSMHFRDAGRLIRQTERTLSVDFHFTEGGLKMIEASIGQMAHEMICEKDEYLREILLALVNHSDPIQFEPLLNLIFEASFEGKRKVLEDVALCRELSSKLSKQQRLLFIAALMVSSFGWNNTNDSQLLSDPNLNARPSLDLKLMVEEFPLVLLHWCGVADLMVMLHRYFHSIPRELHPTLDQFGRGALSEEEEKNLVRTLNQFNAQQLGVNKSSENEFKYDPSQPRSNPIEMFGAFLPNGRPFAYGILFSFMGKDSIIYLRIGATGVLCTWADQGFSEMEDSLRSHCSEGQRELTYYRFTPSGL